MIRPLEKPCTREANLTMFPGRMMSPSTALAYSPEVVMIDDPQDCECQISLGKSIYWAIPKYILEFKLEAFKIRVTRSIGSYQ
jgi:hypothetical protein